MNKSELSHSAQLKEGHQQLGNYDFAKLWKNMFIWERKWKEWGACLTDVASKGYHTFLKRIARSGNQCMKHHL